MMLLAQLLFLMLFEKWDVSEDSRNFYLLSEGMKWSDGEPFTADDILFVYEDVLMNEELTPHSHAGSQWMVNQSKLKKVNKLHGEVYILRFSTSFPLSISLAN